MNHFNLLIILLLLSGVQSPPTYADTDKHLHDHINKFFPGFVILDRSEISKAALNENKSDPTLIMGKFKQDSRDDFAALIRAKKKKTYTSPQSTYDYYDGMLVVCFGQKGASYLCQEISHFPIIIPYNAYLIRTGRKKTSCYEENGKKKAIDVRTDAIGWYIPEKGGGDYIYQPKDKSFLNCVTSD